MPELPEVETIRNGLRRFILNQKISKVEILDKKILNDFPKKFNLLDDCFLEIDRVGKLLIFNFKKSSLKLLIHLRMTGQLVFCQKNKKIKKLILGGHSDRSTKINCQNLKHLRFKIIFKNGDELNLNDTRRFAKVSLVSPDVLLLEKKKFGIEPLSSEFSYLNFLEIIKNKKSKNIKSFLLDQSLIAGIGNIYADEILFSSKINPIRNVGSLSKLEVADLHKNINKIIKLAVDKKGTTFSDYVDIEGKSGSFLGFLQVYGRDALPCKKCKNTIKKIKLAGRGTHYCSFCQK